MSPLLWMLWISLVWVMSSLTLSTGIGAGAVYAPVLVFVFGLDLPAAIATTIVIQIAGVGNTAIGHLASGGTDLRLALRLGAFGAVGVGAASLAASAIPLLGTEIAFVIGMGAIGIWLMAGRRLAVSAPVADGASVLRTNGGVNYEFCRPHHGYGLAAAAGAGTAALGISGAEVQISALMLRCGIPAGAAVGTGTAASTLALLVAAVLTIGNVAWPFALVGIPAAVAGSFSARRLALRLPTGALRVGIGVLAVLSALGVAIRATNGL